MSVCWQAISVYWLCNDCYHVKKITKKSCIVFSVMLSSNRNQFRNRRNKLKINRQTTCSLKIEGRRSLRTTKKNRLHRSEKPRGRFNNSYALAGMNCFGSNVVAIATTVSIISIFREKRQYYLGTVTIYLFPN